MTRQKKTRKQGSLGAKSKPKPLRERSQPPTGKKPQNTKGRPPGNRHVLQTNHKPHSSAAAQQDPRVGSKRKIPLQVPVSAAAQQHIEEEVSLSPEQAFARLESDPKLQSFLEQLDAGQTLSDKDQAWVDQQLERYQALANELGIDLEDDLELDDEATDDEELEPWQQFENPKDWIKE